MSRINRAYCFLKPLTKGIVSGVSYQSSLLYLSFFLSSFAYHRLKVQTG